MRKKDRVPWQGKERKKLHTENKEGGNNILDHSPELWLGLRERAGGWDLDWGGVGVGASHVSSLGLGLKLFLPEWSRKL